MALTRDKWEIQLRKGLLDYFVLLVLAQQDRHGYAIAAELRGLDAFDVAEGTLYPLLARLSKRGAVEPHWVTDGAGPARKVYSITPQGFDELAMMRSAWSRLDGIQAQLGDRG